MTNEQAIKWIKQIQKVGYQDNLLNHKESLDIAIKALEQINKIADIVDGTIDHFEYDDAMDMLYEIKGVIK